MSEVKVNKISPRTACGTTTLGDSGDTFTIPSGATITNLGTATGFGATGAVSWNTTKITADPGPAVTGTGYFCDTTGGGFTVTLPLSPSAGDVVGVSDYAKTFDTNALILGRNGSNIGGTAVDATLSTEGVAVTLVYVDATKGWIVTDSGNQTDAPGSLYVTATGGTITCCGNYKMHAFTGPGTFVVTCAGNPSGSTVVDYMVVAGGGGGGGEYAGGGGAGGYRESVPSPAAWTGSPIAFSGNARPVTATPYAITVGGGGAGGPTGTPKRGGTGNDSIFSDITSAGGGGGGSDPGGPPCRPGGNGGSGGGSSYCNPPEPPSTAGAGDTPNVTPDQGFPGGEGITPGAGGHPGGGGGGAGAAGSPAPACNVGGAGGAGVTSCISATPTARAGGGGGAGGGGAQAYSPGAGGAGGGGAGAADSPSGAGTAGGCYTGGGGGASNYVGPSVGGNGGGGVVILRYKYQ